MQLCCKEFGSKIKELLFDFFEVFRGLFCGGLGTCVMFFHGFTRGCFCPTCCQQKNTLACFGKEIMPLCFLFIYLPFQSAICDVVNSPFFICSCLRSSFSYKVYKENLELWTLVCKWQITVAVNALVFPYCFAYGTNRR